MKNVIIIGSGIGGLCAGNLLARKGHKVTIFESHSMPGGYTAGFERKGYYFESGTVNLEASATVFKAMKDIGVLDSIDFVKLKTRLVSESFDGIPESYDDFKVMMYSGFPNDKERLDSAFCELDKIAGALGSINAPMPFMYSGLGKIVSMLPYIKNAFKMIKAAKLYGGLPSSEFAARFFEKGSRLYRVFMGSSYPDMPALMVGGNLLSLFSDIWTVKNGMQSWADILAENFVKLGGVLKLKSYVDRIITRDGKAAGVSCKGADYYADHIISAGDYKKTILKLLDDKSLIPDDFMEKTACAPMSEGYFTVYLGLNMSNEELSAYMKTPHVFTFDKSADYDIYNSGDAEFFSKTSVSFYSPSMVNRKLAPEGKSSLMLQVMVPYRWMNNWGGGEREIYKQLKGKAMEAVIDHASRIIPNLKECIDYKDAATPLTYERFTHNTDGATSSWSWNPRKPFYKSSMSINTKTPIKNLHIGSCWAMQIGGVPGALGAAWQCARNIK